MNIRNHLQKRKRTRSPFWMRGQAGFTLLEVMIAIGILAVSLLAIFNLQSTSLLGSARAQKIALSAQLGRMKMAQILMDLEAGIAKGEFPEEKEESGTFEEDQYPDFGWRLKVKKVEIPIPSTPEGEEGAFTAQALALVTQQITEATREVQLTIVWRAAEDEEETGLVLTTHIVKM